MKNKTDWACGAMTCFPLREVEGEEAVKKVLIEKMENCLSSKIQNILRVYLPCNKRNINFIKDFIRKNDQILKRYKNLTRTPFKLGRENYDKSFIYLSFDYIDYTWLKKEERKAVKKLEIEIKKLGTEYNKKTDTLRKKIKEIKDGNY